MANYIRYQQRNKLRDKSSLFFLCSFILVVVYTSVIGFVLVHVLKITKNIEDTNDGLLETNKKLEGKLELLVSRLEKLEDKNSVNSSAIPYVNIIPRKQLKTITRGKKDGKFNKDSRKDRKIES
ncbi:hypothetical protein OS493_004852 [Desmophyllum pertusum]|uniref:Uncharacterized protein n=1 Tax=Desmophyllum pertusum TaxID=174260 RepID=A0A9W9Z6Y8_9CNID|nr:hypothetical protein OS493_004852 [Desmophyllum pertusum]